MSKTTKTLPDPRVVEFNKKISEIKKNSKISECFYHKKEECSGTIKQAHSLQRNGRLSVIEGDVNGESKIYTFASYIPSEERLFGDLKPIGKAVASTFFGFCDHHDTVLFSDIENHPFDVSDKHCFLHSYRSFAHTYHMQREKIVGLKHINDNIVSFKNEKIKGNELGLADAEISKAKLDRMIESKSYSELHYLVHVINRVHPVACASVINPAYYYDNKAFNLSADETDHYSDIILTVLPDTYQTIIILACFPYDLAGIKFLDQLQKLPNLKFERAISSLMISNVENTFFAPALWNALGEEGRDKLLSELSFLAYDRQSPDINIEGFFHSETNFFDYRFSANRIKI